MKFIFSCTKSRYLTSEPSERVRLYRVEHSWIISFLRTPMYYSLFSTLFRHLFITTVTHCLQPNRHDLNQWCQVTIIPNCQSLSSRTPWSTLPKALFISKCIIYYFITLFLRLQSLKTISVDWFEWQHRCCGLTLQPYLQCRGQSTPKLSIL